MHSGRLGNVEIDFYLVYRTRIDLGRRLWKFTMSDSLQCEYGYCWRPFWVSMALRIGSKRSELTPSSCIEQVDYVVYVCYEKLLFMICLHLPLITYCEHISVTYCAHVILTNCKHRLITLMPAYKPPHAYIRNIEHVLISSLSIFQRAGKWKNNNAEIVWIIILCTWLLFSKFKNYAIVATEGDDYNDPNEFLK